MQKTRKYLCIHNGIYMNYKNKLGSLAAQNTYVQASERSPPASPFSADGVFVIVFSNNSNGNRRNTSSNEEHWSWWLWARGFSLVCGTVWEISCTPTDSVLPYFQYSCLGWGPTWISAQYLLKIVLKLHWVNVRSLGSHASCTSSCCRGFRCVVDVCGRWIS